MLWIHKDSCFIVGKMPMAYIYNTFYRSSMFHKVLIWIKYNCVVIIISSSALKFLFCTLEQYAMTYIYAVAFAAAALGAQTMAFREHFCHIPPCFVIRWLFIYATSNCSFPCFDTQDFQLRMQRTIQWKSIFRKDHF